MKFCATLGLGFSVLLLAGVSTYGEMADPRYANTIAYMPEFSMLSRFINSGSVPNLPQANLAALAWT